MLYQIQTTEEYKKFKRTIKRKIKKLFPTVSSYLMNVWPSFVYNQNNAIVDFCGEFNLFFRYKNNSFILLVEFNKVLDTFYISDNSIMFKLIFPLLKDNALKDFYFTKAELSELITFKQNYDSTRRQYILSLDEMHNFIQFFRKTILLKRKLLEL